MRVVIVEREYMDTVDDYGVHDRGMGGSTGVKAGQNIRRKKLFSRLPWWRGKADPGATISTPLKESVSENSDFRMAQRGWDVHWGGASNGKGRNKRGPQKLQCAGRRAELQNPQVETILDVMQKRVRQELTCLPSGKQCDSLTSLSLRFDPTSCAGPDSIISASDTGMDQGVVHQTGAESDRHILEHHLSTNCGQFVTYPLSPDMEDLQQMLNMECRRCLFVTFVMASGLRLVGQRRCWPLLELFLVPWMPVHSHGHGQSSIPRWRRWSHVALKIGVALSTRFCSSFLGPFLTAHAFLSMGGFRPSQTSTVRNYLSSNTASVEISSIVCPHAVVTKSHGPPYPQPLNRHPEEGCATPNREVFMSQQNGMAEGNTAVPASAGVKCTLAPDQTLRSHEFTYVMGSEDERRLTDGQCDVDCIAEDSVQGLVEQVSHESLIFDSSCTTLPQALLAFQESAQPCDSYVRFDPGNTGREVMVLAPCHIQETVASCVDGRSFNPEAVTRQNCADILALPALVDEVTEAVGGDWMQCPSQTGPSTGHGHIGSDSEATKPSPGLENAVPLLLCGTEPYADYACMHGRTQELHPCFIPDSIELNSLDAKRAGCELAEAYVNQGQKSEGNEHFDCPMAVPLNGEDLFNESPTDELLCTPLNEFEDTVQPILFSARQACRDNTGLPGTVACEITVNMSMLTETGTGASCLDLPLETGMDNTCIPTASLKADTDEKWSEFGRPESAQIYEADTASLTSSNSSSSLGFTDSEDEMMQSGDTVQSIQPAQDPTFQVGEDLLQEDPLDGCTWNGTDNEKLLSTHDRELDPVHQLSGVTRREHLLIPQITLESPKLGQVVYSHSDHPTCVAMRSKRHANADQEYWKLSDLQASPWGHMVFWHGHCRDSRPTLCVLLGKAVCNLSPPMLDSLIPVIVSHMELAELNLFAGSAKQMNLLLDLSGLGLLRMPPMDILQRLGTVLNRDYAGRGGSVYVLNAPVMLSIVVSAIKGVILRPSYNRGAMIEKGFLVSKESILVLGRRASQVLEKHFAPHMIHAYFGGQCSCKNNSRSCNVGYNFLLTLS